MVPTRIFRTSLLVLPLLFASIVPPAIHAITPQESAISSRTEMQSDDFADRGFSIGFELFYAGPEWFLNALSNPRSRNPFVKTFMYDSAGDRLRAENGYVGTLRDVFDVGLFSNISFAGHSAGGKTFSPRIANAGSSNTWTGNTDVWSVGANWSPVGPPTAGDSAVLTFQGSGSSSYTSTNDLGPFLFGGVVLNSTSTATNTISGNDLLVSLTGASYIQQNDSGAFNIQNNFSIDATASISATSLNLTGNGAGRVTLSGTIADVSSTNVVGVYKTGTSTFALTGANTYSRGTEVNGGTLLVNNASGSGTGTGPVTVNNSGTLGGTGALSVSTPITPTDRTVTVNDGGTIAPGDGPNQIGALTMTATQVVFNANSILLIDLNATQSDLLSITGILNLLSLTAKIDFNTLATPTAPIYNLVTATLIEGTFTPQNVPEGYDLVYTGTTIDLVNLSAIPEPSTWIGGVFTLLTLGFSQRRKLLRIGRK